MTYAAVFQIRSTFGPVVKQSGTVPAGYVAIVCAMDVVAMTLSCADGASGANTVLQVCDGDLLFLGTAVGTGCTVLVLENV